MRGLTSMGVELACDYIKGCNFFSRLYTTEKKDNLFSNMLFRTLRIHAILAVPAALMIAAFCMAQDEFDFTIQPIPESFSVGQHYPDAPEEEVCRRIVDVIDRNSARFDNELSTFTTQAGINDNVRFHGSDTRIMSLRAQAALNTLAAFYGDIFTIVKAWSQFPDPELVGDDLSLHYEGA